MAGISQPTAALKPPTALQTFVPQSSFLALLEYDPVNLRLTSHLLDGAIYQHTFVLASDWQALQTSQNHGKHWAKNIKGQKLSIKIKSAKAPKSELHRRKK